MSAAYIAGISQFMSDSKRGKPLDSIALTTIADIIEKTGDPLLIPDFNECAKRIAWGKLPEPGCFDVFQKYRESGILTWPLET